MLCLNAGKHVLCEKAFTVNEAQARKLYAVAKEKNLFLMEAVWTRFFPISIRVREMIQQGLLGDVHRVMADNSFGTDVEGRWGTDHRMVNMDLAGGALLDCEFSLLLSPFYFSCCCCCCCCYCCCRRRRLSLSLRLPFPMRKETK